MARPIEYDADRVAEQLEAYIKDSTAPLIEEFLLMDESPCKGTLYKLAKPEYGTIVGTDEEGQPINRLMNAIKRCHMKNALHLERGVEAGIIPPGWAAFKRKQAAYGGWRDKQEIEQTIEHKGIDVSIKVIE